MVVVSPLRTACCLWVLVCLLAGPVAAQTGETFQVVAVKVKEDVTSRAGTADATWQDVVPLTVLESGYLVRTGEDSFTLLRFPDETKLSVRPLSLVEITGQVEAGQAAGRTVRVDGGGLAFDVRKRETENFRFVSPTSVTSIRGTVGGLTVDDDSTTTLHILSGLATMTNSDGSQSVEVGPGQTGIVDSQGNVLVRQTSDAEQRDVEGTLTGEGAVRQIRIIGQDEDGNPRTIIIEWQQDQ